MPGQKHHKLVQRGVDLGVVPKNQGGVCLGVSMKWLENQLLLDKQAFEKRMKRILNDSSLPQKITKLKEKVRNKEELGDDEKELSNILAFYDGILSYYSMGVFHAEGQAEIDVISGMAASTNTEKAGGLKSIYNEAGIYTKEGIEQHLNKLSSAIDKVGYTHETEIGFVITSTNHAVAVSYNTEHHSWQVMDINQWKPKSKIGTFLEYINGLKNFILQLIPFFKSESNQSKVASTIYNAFKLSGNERQDVLIKLENRRAFRRSSPESMALNTVALVTGDNPELKATQEQLNKVKQHLTHSDLDSYISESRIDLLYLAITHKHDDITELFKNKNSNNVRLFLFGPNHNEQTCFDTAIMEKNKELVKFVLDTLPNHSSYINKKFRVAEYSYLSPLAVAVLRDDAVMAHLLLCKGADPDLGMDISADFLKECSRNADVMDERKLYEFIDRKLKEPEAYKNLIHITPSEFAEFSKKKEMQALFNPQAEEQVTIPEEKSEPKRASKPEIEEVNEDEENLFQQLYKAISDTMLFSSQLVTQYFESINPTPPETDEDVTSKYKDAMNQDREADDDEPSPLDDFKF